MLTLPLVTRADLVARHRDRVEGGLAIAGQLRALGQILPGQAVGVLGATALSGTVRVDEVHRDPDAARQRDVRADRLGASTSPSRQTSAAVAGVTTSE